jgi:hypothetical protein
MLPGRFMEASREPDRQESGLDGAHAGFDAAPAPLERLAGLAPDPHLDRFRDPRLIAA